MSSPLTPAHDPDAAPRFGRFMIIEQAGAGAMGTVYAAYDPTLDRRVALKVLRSGTGRNQQERIRREALAMARVDHDNVVRVYEVGEEAGRLFIAMEFVEGTTLKAWNAEPRAWREVARMYAEVARGLAAAHAVGLVHRDFKPDNVLVDRQGRPRIIDFGLARATDMPAPLDDGAGVDEAPEADPVTPSPDRLTDSVDDLVGSNDLLAHALTRTGHVMGTPAYMAPELMDRAAPTPRSDQFAFGVAFYEALCGQPPFPRESLLGLKLAVARGEVTPPPTDRDLPDPLLAVVLRTLAPDPSARFTDMQALIDDLERQMSDQELFGWRARLVILALFVVGLLAVLLSRRSGAGPSTAADLVRSELIIGACIIVGLAPFHRALRASALNRRGAIWVLLITPFKVLVPLIGVVFGLSLDVILAYDALVITLMSAVATFLIHLAVWPALLIDLVAFAALLIQPAWTTPMHDIAFMALPLVVGIQALLAARRAGWSGLLRSLRSRPDPGPEGRG